MTKTGVGKDSLSFVEFLQLFTGSWQVLTMGVLLGGAIGLGLSYLMPPVYEATAVYDFSIDFARTGLLTDIEEDQALEIAGDIIKSSAVMENALAAAKEIGIQIPEANIGSIFQAERRFNQWLLKVHWNDSADAARLANLWGESARSVLINSESASLNSDALQRHILSLETCLQQSTSGLPVQPLCQVSNRNDLLLEIENSGKDLLEWRARSNGLFPGLNFTWTQNAQIPSTPIQHSRGSLTIAGGMAGFFAAAMLSLMNERKRS